MQQIRGLITLILLIFSCPVTGTGQHASVQGIELRMTEVARDGRFAVSPNDRFRKVDANSTLRLEFTMPQLPSDLEASPEWRGLTDALRMLRSLAERFQRLSEVAQSILASGATGDTAFERQADSLAARYDRFLDFLVAQSILTDDQLDSLMLKRTNDPYTALAEEIHRQRASLHANAARLAEQAESYEVVLRAFLLPKSGGREALHIPGYDNLPQGDFRPLDPTGLLPTAEDAARLRAELEAARKVTLAIRELRRNGAGIETNVRELLSDLSTKVTTFVDRARTELIGKLPENWEDLLSEEFIASLPSVTVLDVPGLIRELNHDVTRIRELVALAQRIRDTLSPLPGADRALAALEEIVAHADTFLTTSRAIIDGIPQSQERIAAITEALSRMASATVDTALGDSVESLRDNVVGTLRGSLAGIETELPNTTSALDVVVQFFNLGVVDNVNALKKLDGEDVVYIPHPLTDLKPAELDLRYAGIAVGDEVLFTADIRPIEPDDPPLRARPASAKYQVGVTLAGWHTRYDSNVIFSRTFAGDASDDFRSNVALSLELHHFDRQKPNSFLNKLDPGLGLHAAFLDQDDEQSVEMGGGCNLSILDGLVRVGVGFNVTAGKDREYWFFGFGLFGLLGSVRDLVQTF